MLNALTDNASLVSLVLGSLAVIVFVLWWRTRQRGYAVATAAVLAAFGLFLVFAFLFAKETDRQQIERKVREMADAARTKDMSRIGRHISQDFVSPGKSNKADFLDRTAEKLRTLMIQEVVVWGFEFGEVSRASRTAVVRFSVKVKSTADWFAACEATFQLDTDGEWRLKGFEVFYPPNTTQKFPFPY